jgi:transposase
MTIVMGLDQHRAQITGEWIDTETGELQRARVAPADRAAVRRFLAQFRGRELEVALEATTGWRFLVEELRRVGAVVHLAEPAETAGLRGTKKRPKNDRADARHLRELLMIKRLPESWIPPDYILDLRARVRLRHTLSEQRSEWQQRIQAVLYHHGLPQRRQLMTADGREWLQAQPLSDVARGQVRIATAMVDELERQIAPLDKELKGYARRQAGCKALMGIYGIGALTAVTILAELGDVSRFSSSRDAVRYSGLDITVKQSDQRRAPGHISRQGPPALRWALYEAAQIARRGRAAPIASTTWPPRSGSAEVARVSRSRASCSSAPTTRCASSARRHSYPPEPERRAPRPSSHRCAAAGSRQPPAATTRCTAYQDRAAATLPPAGSPNQTSCRRPGADPGRGPK